MKFIILHGVSGFAGKYWMQWLNNQLTEKGHDVLMPDLNNPDHPKRQEWFNQISDLIKNLPKSNIVIIGHSLGVPAALDVIETFNEPIKSLISVAGFFEDYGLEINTDFMKEKSIDIKRAKELIEIPVVIHSDNDPYVPQNILDDLAKGLEVEPIVIKNGGHFNSDTEFKKEFPLLLNIIETII